MTDNQSLGTIDLVLLQQNEDGRKYKYTATINGNNVAWMCICGYRLPLIWSGFQPQKPTMCGGCGKKFIGRGQPKEKPKGSPTEVHEIE